MKRVLYIALVAIALSFGSCFKETVDYTRFNLAVQEQTQNDGKYVPLEHLEAYAYYADTAQWKITDYQAALERRLTNKKDGKTLTTPDVEATAGPDEQYRLTLELREEVCLLVVVDPEHKIYAVRPYRKPENLADVYAKLYIATWRQSHNASGWSVINQFYSTEKTE